MISAQTQDRQAVFLTRAIAGEKLIARQSNAERLVASLNLIASIESHADGQVDQSSHFEGAPCRLWCKVRVADIRRIWRFQDQHFQGALRSVGCDQSSTGCDCRKGNQCLEFMICERFEVHAAVGAQLDRPKQLPLTDIMLGSLVRPDFFRPGK